ncbi:MAG TPA: type I methionyl aminopeptidase [Acidimicrobiales bacterium]|jgi:methionyl aminopeptidase|nr:type I methionyl aminopeptidase [Acidimicrobiales bacterium]
MVELKTSREIGLLREAGRVVAEALAAVRERAAVGVTLAELDRVAAKVIEKAGATPAFLGYHPSWAPTPFPGVICASVNDAVVHGVPDRRRLADGDLVSIDCGAFVRGWCGDAATSFIVGTPRPGDTELIAATDAALDRGIAAAQAGNQLGDVGAAIATPARKSGYGLLEYHGGHGVGRAMHEDPFVPNEGRAGRGYRLRPGLVIAIEPMLIAGGADEYVTDPDGWTLRTASGSRAAHSEHTIAVTENGPIVLTAL